jgi:hypothetical protein
VDRKWKKKDMSPTKTLKTRRPLQQQAARQLHPKSAMWMKMMLFLPLQLLPFTINTMFNLVKIEVPSIAICFQAGWMGSMQKEKLPFQA